MSGQRITAIHMWVTTDDAGDEGVIGFMSGNQWIPMVAADEKRLRSLRPLAEATAKEGKRKVTLIRFAGEREELEVIEP